MKLSENEWKLLNFSKPKNINMPSINMPTEDMEKTVKIVNNIFTIFENFFKMIDEEKFKNYIKQKEAYLIIEEIKNKQFNLIFYYKLSFEFEKITEKSDKLITVNENIATAIFQIAKENKLPVQLVKKFASNMNWYLKSKSI